MDKAKPLPRRSFEEREKIVLDAAMALFSEKGFKGTTTKAIAQSARVNEALLFRHFPTKESLYTALLRRKLSQLFLHVIPILEKTLRKPLATGLFQIGKRVIQEHRKDPQIFRMMLFSALENHRLSGAFLKERLPIGEFLERFFKERMARGDIVRQDPVILTRAFLALIQNYILMTQVFSAKKLFPKSEDHIIRSYVKIFLRGILA